MADATWIRLCRLDELPQPGARGFDLSGRGTDDLFIVRRGGLLRAYRNSCPHWPEVTLPWRKNGYLDSKAEHVVCHGHGARFTLDDGLCVQGPCVGLKLQAIPLRVEDGRHISVLIASPERSL